MASTNKEPCTFFAKGSCNKGASCGFLHGGMPAADYVAAVASGRSMPPTMPATPPRPSSTPRPARPSSTQRNTRNDSSSKANSNRPPSTGRRPPAGAITGGNAGGILSTLPHKTQQREFTLSLGNGQSAVLQVKSQQALRTTAKPPLIVHAYFLIDASGSMAGERMASTLEHVDHTVRSVLDPDDLVTIWIFSDELKLDQVYYKTRAAAISLDTLKARVKVGGCTRLYDNCTHAVQCMAKDRALKDAGGNTILRNLVVFTDGADNKSDASSGLANMTAAIRAPGVANFNFTCLAVGEEGAQEGAKLRDALQGCRHAKVVITSGASKDDIGKAFGRAQASLREAKTELIEQLMIQCRSNTAEPVLARAIQSGLAGLTLSGGGGGKGGGALAGLTLGGGGGGGKGGGALAGLTLGGGGGNSGGGGGRGGGSRPSTPSRRGGRSQR